MFKYEYFVTALSLNLIPLPVQVLGLEALLGSEDLWPVLLGITVMPTVLQMALLPFCPESPRFLYIVRCQEHLAKRGETQDSSKNTINVLEKPHLLSGTVFDFGVYFCKL